MTYRRTLILTAALLAAITVSSSLRAGGDRGKPSRPQQVTLTGTVVDLQSYMTGKCPGDDLARCTRDNVRSGVPAALETEDGLVIIGMGDKGPARLLVPLARQHVEVKGSLFEKDGIQYIDMTAAKAIKDEEAESEEEEAEEDEQQP